MSPHWMDIGAFWISIAATLAAGSAAAISYILYRSQSDPEVVVYAVADEKRPSIINLVVENIGKRPALGVTFSWEGKLPARAWGMTLESAEQPGKMNEGPLVRGIPFLPPGGKRVITWGQYWGLFKGLGTNILDVDITYKSRRFVIPRARSHKTTCPIEIVSFEATDASDTNFDKKIAQNIEELKKTIHRESRGWMNRLETRSEQEKSPNDEASAHS